MAMILLIAKAILWFFPKLDISRVQRYVLYALLAVVAGVVLFAVVFLFRACNRPPKLDQKEIIKAQQAIETNDRKVMVEILSNSDVREQGIDNSIKAAEEATEQAKQNYQGQSNAELAAELERRLKEE